MVLALATVIATLGLGAASAPQATSKQQPRKLLGFSGVRPERGSGSGEDRPAHPWHRRQREPYDAALAGARARARRLPRGALRALRAALRGAQGCGDRAVFVLQFAPAWARDPGGPQDCGASDSCHFPPAVEMLGEWGEFVAEVAQRFPAATIEVWNEPNYAGQWQSGVDPQRTRSCSRSLIGAAAARPGDPGHRRRARHRGEGQLARRERLPAQGIRRTSSLDRATPTQSTSTSTRVSTLGPTRRLRRRSRTCGRSGTSSGTSTRRCWSASSGRRRPDPTHSRPPSRPTC